MLKYYIYDSQNSSSGCFPFKEKLSDFKCWYDQNEKRWSTYTNPDQLKYKAIKDLGLKLVPAHPVGQVRKIQDILRK